MIPGRNKRRNRPQTRTASACPRVDTLPERVMLSATNSGDAVVTNATVGPKADVSVSNDVLIIRGTSSTQLHDDIEVSRENSVSGWRYVIEASVLDNDGKEVSSQRYHIYSNDLESIRFYGFRGDDNFQNSTSLPGNNGGQQWGTQHFFR